MNFEDKLLELNNAQKNACMCIDGPICVSAGAGAGKTKVLTTRIAYLVSQKINPASILAITFTEGAQKEMRTRLADMLGKDICSQIFIKTFHSFGLWLIQQHKNLFFGNNCPDVSVCDERLANKLIWQIVKQLKLRSSIYPPTLVLPMISLWKNEMRTPDDIYEAAEEMGDVGGYDTFNRRDMARIYQRYQEILFDKCMVDFGDMLMLPNRLFDTSSTILEQYQEQFRYVLIDEYQDTNAAQYSLILRLTQKRNNIFVVGDIDQSIYSFQGADYKNFSRFIEDFPSAKKFTLEQNYRSTKNILETANALISHNATSDHKKLWTDGEDGSVITCCEAKDRLMEAQWILSQINSIQNETGAQYSDFTILMRNNSQTASFEQVFHDHDIPFEIIGGISFYLRPEIRNLLNYLRIIANPSDDEAFLEILNVPNRFISNARKEKFIDVMEKNEMGAYEFFAALVQQRLLTKIFPAFCVSALEQLYRLLENARALSSRSDPAAVLDYVIKETHYKKYLKSIAQAGGAFDDFEEKSNNVDALFQECAELGYKLENYRIEDFIAYTDDAIKKSYKKTNGDSVKLMTIHKAKGMEFPYVFLCGVNENILPSFFSLFSDEDDALEEERRLLYVAITRAKYRMAISYVAENYRGEPVAESRFIHDIPMNLLNYVRFPDDDNSAFEDTPVVSKTVDKKLVF